IAVAKEMRSVAKARPMHCAILAKELDTWIWGKPRRSISRAVSSVARRRPGIAIRFRAGKGEGIAFLRNQELLPAVQPPDRHSGAPRNSEPEIHFPGPVFMDSGSSPAGYPGMTSPANGSNRLPVS